MAGFTSNLISFTLETRHTTPTLKELSSIKTEKVSWKVLGYNLGYKGLFFFFTIWQCNLNFLVLQINSTDEPYTLLFIFASAIWKSSTQFGFMLADHLSSAQRWRQSTNSQCWDHDIQFPADTNRETPAWPPLYITENASPNYPMKDSKNSPENDFLGTPQLVNAMHET